MSVQRGFAEGEYEQHNGLSDDEYPVHSSRLGRLERRAMVEGWGDIDAEEKREMVDRQVDIAKTGPNRESVNSFKAIVALEKIKLDALKEDAPLVNIDVNGGQPAPPLTVEFTDDFDARPQHAPQVQNVLLEKVEDA